MSKKIEYYCVAVRRNYEDKWRVISRHDTQAEAQAALEEKRSYTGAFNYDNAELRVISRSEAKKEFGSDWEYQPIGVVGAVKAAAKVNKRRSKNADDDF